MNHLAYACTLVRTDLPVALEFGVYTGDSIRTIRACLPPQVEVHGFDSFVGLPEDWRTSTGDLVGACARGFFSTDGVVPDVPRVTAHVGWFADTVPNYLAERRRPVGLVHVDCDLYASTRTVLDLLNPVIVRGTILVFDEWLYHTANGVAHNDHEARAFRDWLVTFDRGGEFVPYWDDPSRYANERRIVRITR